MGGDGKGPARGNGDISVARAAGNGGIPQPRAPSALPETTEPWR